MFSILWPGKSNSTTRKTAQSHSLSPPPDSTFSEPVPNNRYSPVAKRHPVIINENDSEQLILLRDLVAAVPPKTLHNFVSKRLDTSSAAPFPTLDTDMPTLAAFFAGLTPPPVKHCARCHQDFVDIENGPRSCVKEHDDESATVSHGIKGLHETLWGCCGQTVDGDGDLGPPAGWCFEGLHTSDRLEARYRDDGDSEDDKLESCETRRCGQAPRPRKKLKRSRAAAGMDSESDDESIDLNNLNLEPRAKHNRKVSEGGIKRVRSKSRLKSPTDGAGVQDEVMADATKVKHEKNKPKEKAPASKRKSTIPTISIEAPTDDAMSPHKPNSTRSAMSVSTGVGTSTTNGRGRGRGRGGGGGTKRASNNGTSRPSVKSSTPVPAAEEKKEKKEKKPPKKRKTED